MTHTAVVYTSKSGATREVAEKITKILVEEYNIDVENIDLREKKAKNIGSYDSLVIASGIRMDAWYYQSERFMKKKLENKKIAIFTCSGTAGTEGKYEYALEKYVKGKINRYLDMNKVVAFEAFGGMKYKDEPEQDGTKEIEYDYRDWEKIEKWAKELGEIFSGKKEVETPLYEPEISPYGKKKTIINCILLGIVGIHRYKTGYLGSGILYSLTLGVLGMGVVKDLIKLLKGEWRDGFGRKIVNWEEEKNTKKVKGIF